DQNANDKQTEALGAIFTGAAGGPMAQLAPLIGENLGAKKVPITYRVEGKMRSAEIPNILHMTVDPLPTAHPSGEMWANIGHPVILRYQTRTHDAAIAILEIIPREVPLSHLSLLRHAGMYR